MIVRVEEGPKQLHWNPWTSSPHFPDHLLCKGPEQVGFATEPVAAKAKTTIELSAASDATKLVTQNPFSQIEMATIGVRVGGDQHIRAEVQKLTNQVSAPE